MLGVALSAIAMNAQEKFELTPAGFTDFVVTTVPDKTQSDLYKKTMDWLQVTYKNPDEVIKAKIENDYIRIEGSSPDLVTINALGRTPNLTRYQIEIGFKDGKYKFDLLSLEYYHKASVKWLPVKLDDGSDYFNKKGELRSVAKYYPEISDYFNNLNNSLKDYIEGKSATSAKKNDW